MSKIGATPKTGGTRKKNNISVFWFNVSRDFPLSTDLSSATNCVSPAL